MTIVSQTVHTAPVAPSANPNAAPAAPQAAAPLAAPSGTPAAPAQPDTGTLVLDEGSAVPAAPNPAQAPVPQAPAPGAKEEIVYDKTGNPGLDLTLGFLGKHGYTPEHPAMEAAQRGDFSLLRADLAQRGITNYQDILAVGESVYSAKLQESKAAEAKTLTAIHEIAGGAKEWQAIQVWANQNAEPQEKASVNVALRAGGFVAKAVARALAEKFASAAGTSYSPRQEVAPGAGGAAPTSGVLSPEGYKAALNELKSRVGAFGIDQHPEYAHLRARRAAWRG